MRLPANTPALLRAAGLTVVEVDGWETRGRPASTGGFAPVGVLCHHTATSKASPDAAVIRLLVMGRSDLPGPLCHFGLGRNGTVYVIASGRANHAGKAKASGTVAAGDGNSLYIGVEAFNDGRGEPWPSAQYDAYVLLCAALSKKITGNSVNTVRAHKETSVTGKIDPTFSMDAFRSRVAAAMERLSATKPAPLRYRVTSARPTGDEYHGPGNASSAAGLALYHRTNSLRGIRHAKRAGFKWVDIDVMTTADDVLIGNHSFGAMWKEGFRAPGVPLTVIDDLTWGEVGRLRTRGDYRIQKLYRLMEEAARLDIGLALDLKGDRREGWRITRQVGRIVRMANRTGCRIYLKCDPRKAPLRKALHRARELGCWVRWNGLRKFWGPL